MFLLHFLWSNLKPVVQEEHIGEVRQCELLRQGVGVLGGQDVRLECGEILDGRKSAVLCLAFAENKNQILKAEQSLFCGQAMKEDESMQQHKN